ncbi:programmed cell death 1 ligand 1-like isoform X2 [Chelmon rostratus]|uniref:programmed cell death 1 ligand 1-like isoform X2 n=1 Tax=Chelmon rostratus TaxID=109905 RepID=UPI001BEAA099|nr:programmed cell death 1 ligand 1-like isoform X2 [Chelmon rostratus]
MPNIWKMSGAAVCPGGPRLNEDQQSVSIEAWCPATNLHRKKRICSILLLISASCCVSGATLVVDVAQSSYQAEENQNITLEWRFTPKPGSSLDSLSVLCVMLTERKASGLFHLHEGVEAPESRDEGFAGRVQCDRDVLREGRIRLHVSTLRTDDSGMYLCRVSTDYGMNTGTCRLNVTAAVEPEPQRQRMRHEPGSQSQPLLCGGLTLAAVTLLAISVKSCSRRFQTNNPSGLTGVWTTSRNNWT